MSKIELVQKPVIKHDLPSAGRYVTERLADLNLENQVATEDTIQSMKKLRAELNAEFADYEAQRKAIKTAVNAPYVELESAYNTEVAERYNTAIATLKTKIGDYENIVKAEKKANIEAYFAELCLSESIDFLTFESVGLEINLSTTEKKYKGQCNDFVNRIKDDLALIETQEHKAEITVEYKRTLNVSNAITTITKRKEDERLEAERIKQTETKRRTWLLSAIGMTFDEITQCYVYNDALYIQLFDIESFSKDAFHLEYERLSSEIAKDKAISSPVATAEPVKAPTVQPKPQATTQDEKKVYTARFECNVTRAQVEKLKAFLATEQIEYRNIDPKELIINQKNN